MKLIAVVSAGESDPGQLPDGLRQVGGIGILDRQIRQLLSAGVATVWVVAAELPESLSERLAENNAIRRFANATALTEALRSETGEILLLAPGLVIDERLVTAMASAETAPLLLTFRETPPAGAERLDSEYHWAGIARLKAGWAVEVLSELGDWEMTGTLMRAANQQAERLSVADIPIYAPDRRRKVPLIWARPHTDEECRRATDQLIASAQKGCLDWPARFIHAPLENLLTRWLLPTPISPNAVTLFAATIGIAAIYLFAIGQLWWGLGLVLLVGPLDGLDGKLARTRHQFSRWGDLEHVLDKILEYGWYLALGSWFARNGHGLAGWLIAGGIIILSLSEAVKGEMFRRLTGKQLDDWSRIDRNWRLIAGRRNIYFWTLLGFAAFNLWFQGFLVVLLYAVLTFVVAETRFLTAISAYGRAQSATIARNFAATGYAFLPRGRTEAS